MLWIALACILVYCIYLKVIKPLNYWKERNVPYDNPWPIFGSFLPLFRKKKNLVELLTDLYNEFPDKRYIGIHVFSKPQLIIRDPEIIKQITIKDFDNFMDRTTNVSEETDPLFSKNLASLTGQKWREMRATLSPSFTASKMRFMFTLISDCANQFTQYFEKQATDDVINVEMKDICSRFTNDVIATSAFGVTVDSLNDKENEFFLQGRDATNFSGFQIVRFLGHTLIPSVMKFFKIPMFKPSFSQFFTRIIRETIDVREKNGVVRPDMIHLLLEAKKGQSIQDDDSKLTETGFVVVQEPLVDNVQRQEKITITDLDITAQAMIFFFAGFDTASTLMSFISYELAINGDVQKKLQNEIDEILETCNKKITYEILSGMKYLDMVVSETLRKWPPGGAGLDRICLKDYPIKPTLSNEEPLVIEKGISITIPVVAIHRDPKYFPDPEKFDPERFSDENKSNIVPSTYMPFGVGPRSCIASRFALMETKLLFFHLLSKFDIVTTEKTPIPLILSRTKLALMPDEGFCLGLQKRKLKN